MREAFFLSFNVERRLPFRGDSPFNLAQVLVVELGGTYFRGSAYSRSSVPVAKASSIQSLLFDDNSPTCYSSSNSSLEGPLSFLIPMVLSIRLCL